VDRLLEALGELPLGNLTALLDDHLSRNVAPIDDDKLRHLRSRLDLAAGLRIIEEARHLAVAGEAVFVDEADARGRRLGATLQVGILRLREIDQPGIVAEIRVTQLWMPVETEALNHQAIEMAGQIIGEEKRARL